MEVLVVFPLLGALFAGAASGHKGFGTALLLLPCLVNLFGMSQSVPLLTLALLTANLPRALLGFPQIRWRRLFIILAAALPSAAAGALLFAVLPGQLLGAVFVLLLVVLAWHSLTRADPNLADAISIVAAGLLSGLAGSAGPLAPPVCQSPRLAPVGIAATGAAAVFATHGLKWGVYGLMIPPEPGFHALAIAMGIALIVGSWVAPILQTAFQSDTQRQLLALLYGLAAAYMFVVAAHPL